MCVSPGRGWQESCKAKLSKAFEHSKPDTRKMAILGHGNGFSFEATPFCSYAARDSVHVVLAGEVAEWPGISAVATAHDGELLAASNIEVQRKCA